MPRVGAHRAFLWSGAHPTSPRPSADTHAPPSALFPPSTTQVARPLVQSELADILDFRLIPFGNARPAPASAGDGGPNPPPPPPSPWVCQHGPDECTLNTLYACTMAELGSVEGGEGEEGQEGEGGEGEGGEGAGDPLPLSSHRLYPHPRPPPPPPPPPPPARALPPWLDVIACAEDGFPGVMAAFDTCLASKTDAATVAAVAECAAGPRGAAMIAAAAAATASLDPPHRYVPWLVVDGLPVGGQTAANLGALVCAAYRGPRPAACSRSPPAAALGGRRGGGGWGRGVGAAAGVGAW